jgi:hypothetical protein
MMKYVSLLTKKKTISNHVISIRIWWTQGMCCGCRVTGTARHACLRGRPYFEAILSIRRADGRNSFYRRQGKGKTTRSVQIGLGGVNGLISPEEDAASEQEPEAPKKFYRGRAWLYARNGHEKAVAAWQQK